MFAIFPLDLNSNPQVLPLVGGMPGSLNVYLKFATTPSAGTASIEYQRPGTSTWVFLQGCQATSITTGALNGKIDGGVSALRVTFAGLTGGTVPILAVSESETAIPPKDLLTDGGFGANRRIRVDPGETGFFARKMWRISHEFTGLDATPLVLKVVVPVNFIIHYQQLTVDEGGIGLRAYRLSQGTEGGSFSTTVPMYSVNFMNEQASYTFQATVTTGGTFTPAAPPTGVAVETIRVRSANATAQQSTVGESSFGERGLLFDTYYLVLSKLTGVSGASSGVYTLIVEERPAIT